MLGVLSSSTLGRRTFRNILTVATTLALILILASTVLFGLEGRRESFDADAWLLRSLIFKEFIKVACSCLALFVSRRDTTRLGIRVLAVFELVISSLTLVDAELRLPPHSFDFACCIAFPLDVSYFFGFPNIVYVPLKLDSQYWLQSSQEDCDFANQTTRTLALEVEPIPDVWATPKGKLRRLSYFSYDLFRSGWMFQSGCFTGGGSRLF